MSPPDIDTQTMDDKNFMTGDLDQAWGLLGLPRFMLRREHKDADAYYVEDPSKRVLGKLAWVQNGGWALQGAQGNTVAMLWRQHTEDHQVDNLSSLRHLGFHRWEQARRNEENASIYCVANLDKTVRLFVTYEGADAVLDSPQNRPALMMAPGAAHGDVKLVDAYGDQVANVHTETTSFGEIHDIQLTEAEDPFLVAIFAATLSLEMCLRYGLWKSPYQRVQL